MCVVLSRARDPFQVVPAEETADAWEFSLTEGLGDRFCYEIEDPDQKIIAVRPNGSALCGAASQRLYCNPTRCAQEALAAFTSGEYCKEGQQAPSRVTVSFGDDQPDHTDEGLVDIVRGRCGTPGKEGPSEGRRPE